MSAVADTRGERQAATRPKESVENRIVGVGLAIAEWLLRSDLDDPKGQIIEGREIQKRLASKSGALKSPSPEHRRRYNHTSTCD